MVITYMNQNSRSTCSGVGTYRGPCLASRPSGGKKTPDAESTTSKHTLFETDFSHKDTLLEEKKLAHLKIQDQQFLAIVFLKRVYYLAADELGAESWLSLSWLRSRPV